MSPLAGRVDSVVTVGWGHRVDYLLYFVQYAQNRWLAVADAIKTPLVGLNFSFSEAHFLTISNDRRFSHSTLHLARRGKLPLDTSPIRLQCCLLRGLNQVQLCLGILLCFIGSCSELACRIGTSSKRRQILTTSYHPKIQRVRLRSLLYKPSSG